MSCAFCDICERKATAHIVRDFPDAIIIVPLNPVTPGHVLVIPKTHVKDATEYPHVTGSAMTTAAIYAKTAGPCNIITSVGKEATQSVFHLHIHVVPRKAGDGLPLPWTPQQGRAFNEEKVTDEDCG